MGWRSDNGATEWSPSLSSRFFSLLWTLVHGIVKKEKCFSLNNNISFQSKGIVFW